MNHIDKIKQDILSKGARYKSLMENGNDLSAAERKEVADLGPEIKNLKAEYDNLTQGASDADAAIKAVLNTGYGKETVEVDEKGTSLKGISDSQRAAISTNSYKNAFWEMLHVGPSRMSQSSYKAIQEGQDDAGGFLVPEQVNSEMIQKMQGLTPLSDNVRRRTTSRDSLSLPRNNYTTDNIFTSPVRLSQTGEIPASDANVTDPTFGLCRIDVNTFMAVENVTRDVIEDSLFDMTEFIAEKFAEAKAQQMEGFVISGTGIGQPSGILMAPGTTVAGDVQPDVVTLTWKALGSTGSYIDWQTLSDMQFSIPEQYDQRSAFYFNKTRTGKMLARISDTTNQPIMRYGFQDKGIGSGVSNSLLGDSYYYSNQMPSAVTSAGSGIASVYPVIYGDLMGYTMVERANLTIQVLDQTLATRNQLQLVGRWRIGGKVVEPWRMVVGQTAGA